MKKQYDFGVIKIWDYEGITCPFIANEVITKDDYCLKKVDFKPSDVVIDIGANTGIFSIYLAKMYPFVQIYAFEPCINNYNHLLQNIEENGVANVEAYNLAITNNGRKLEVVMNEGDSGCASIYNKCSTKSQVFRNDCCSIILSAFLKSKRIDKIKYLKCDVEGAEYEIFDEFDKWNKVEFFGAELHLPRTFGTCTQEELEKKIRSKLQKDKVFITYG